MFDNQHRVAQVLQPQQGVDQPVIVVGMEAHGGFVTHVEHTGKSGTDLRGQTHPLGLAAGKSARGAVHGHVVQPYTYKELDPPLDLFQDLVGDGFLEGGQDFFLV